MASIAAVMTGPGAGAIATIQLVGDSAHAILQEVFRRADGKPFEFAGGRILLGNIVEGEQVIDRVTVGCENSGAFAIHCHGNPLIVERIMGLLQRHGVQPVRAQQLLATVLKSRGPRDSIRMEANLALTTVKTIEGASLIANQGKAGLAEKARRWQAGLDSMPLDQIAAQAREILKDSETARLVLSGCTIALIGPPNSGKSTLLNTLAGREKAIVTDIRGTTRDWVSAEIRIPPLAATIIDTAGLDSSLGTANGIDEAAQSRSIEMIQRADLILLVLDLSQPAEQIGTEILAKLVGKKAIAVLNKADLPGHFDPALLPAHLETVRLSAKRETGIDDLIRAIHRTCDLGGFSPAATVAFTDRQRVLIERVATTSSRDETAIFLSDLLHGPIGERRD